LKLIFNAGVSIFHQSLTRYSGYRRRETKTEGSNWLSICSWQDVCADRQIRTFIVISRWI